MQWIKRKLRKNKNKLMMLSGLIILFMIAGQLIDWTAVEKKFINSLISEKLDIYIPKGMTAKVEVTATYDYKKELLDRTRQDLRNVGSLLLSSIGLKKNPPQNIPSPKVEKINLDNSQDIATIAAKEQVNTGTWALIKQNLSDAATSFDQALKVRIVSVNNQQYVVKDGKLMGGPAQVMQWASVIEKAARRYNLEPALLAAVMEQESGGNPASVSPSGAIGLMQLMPATARQLQVNPYNPEENINGGAKYLSMMMDEFGNQELALAAYNAGPGNVYNRRYVYIPETMGYVTKIPRLMAKYQKLNNPS